MKDENSSPKKVKGDNSRKKILVKDWVSFVI